ncbi:serine/threonine-protein kinase [Paraliomyxa miuraensis]|uniref:serine/threonine-protein kinase n=1 Tax=Paraliomyxa miuraensis TaxID=376150 RepID=UPI00224E6E29|nr:serine/threonine-protein kinase [Paraliomyxa miuraensis]MCX4243052.1 serine/threonine-protein kinase [Paraliomyxa miuraensis]
MGPHEQQGPSSGDDADLEATAPSGVEDVSPEPDQEEVLQSGTKAGRYMVLDRVGSGGMGVVYAAFDAELDRKVALKVLHARAKPGTNTDGYKRLMREAQAMGKLSHPNVITVYDVGTFEGRVFIAMEFIDGPTLRGWLAQNPREWTEIVDVFVKAGRGLAAAHAAGLVHRDFKPDNVLIGRDGRVLVMDFGLARQAADKITDAQSPRAPDDSTRDSTRDPARDSARADVVLTRTGAVVGTPAYMAPEQHEGSAADPLVDQFGFCVALYEALYGQRPFAGTSVATLAMNVLEGKVRAPPRHTRVPSWLHAVVMRGLSVDPLDRYPSMDALLAELQRDPPQNRRPWLGVAVAVAMLVAVAGVGLATRPPPSDPCEDDDAHLVEGWGSAQRERLREAFSTTSLPYADTSGQTTVRLLDAWTVRWSQHWLDVCHTELPEPSAAPEALPGIRCLDVQRRDLDALVVRLLEADAATVTSAVSAASALPDPSRCKHPELELSLSDRSPPESLDARQRLETLRSTMAQARALLHTGAAAEAARIAEPLRKSVAALADPGLEAEASLVLALALDRQDEPGRAERSLRPVVLQAASGRRPALEAEAWVEMTRVVGERLEQYDEGHRAGLAAETAIVRAHEPPGMRARLATWRASIELDQGRFDEAREHLERALELLREHEDDPASALALALAWQSLGSALHGLGRFDEAQPAFEKALALHEQTLGAQHPWVGATLARMGGTMLGAGLSLQAEATLLRARWLLDPTRATDEPQGAPPPDTSRWQRRELAAVLDRQGLLARQQEELDRAEALHRHALALLEDTVGQGHRDLGYPLVNLGVALAEQERPLDAIAHLRRAYEIWTDELDPEHPDVGIVALDLANVLWTLSDPAKARQHYAEALAIWEEVLPEDHPMLAYALTGLGRCDLALGAHAAAIESLERAYELRAREGIDDLDEAETSLVLARALWATGEDPSRARGLAMRARELVGAVEPSDEAGWLRLLSGQEIPRLTDQLGPASLGATNHDTRGR